MKLPITPGFAIKTLWQEFRSPMFCRGVAQATWTPIRILPYKTQLRVFTVENDVLVKVLFASINLRPYVPSSPQGYPWLEPESTMGNYVTITPHEFDEALVADIRSELPPKITADKGLTASLMDHI
ncbi:hypothetical protein F4810DRAFT_707557 [Camillea tinctor]|nr:hypothetical protein F4810DRAFT_707557 [Camillea tinctor]